MMKNNAMFLCKNTREASNAKIAGNISAEGNIYHHTKQSTSKDESLKSFGLTYKPKRDCWCPHMHHMIRSDIATPLFLVIM